MFGRYSDALASEVSLRGHEMTDDVNTLYIGGGTPSVLPLSVYESLLSALRSVGHGGPYDEFTVEVNPEDIVEKGEAYVEGLSKLGGNRISMGVQSFDDDILRFMNRRHDAATARKAYSVLENAGVGNISIDLIFGLSQLTDLQWSETLKKALDISSRGIPPQHISSYQLSVEPGSMLARMVEKGKWSEASDELCERQYAMLCESLKQAGYSHYEISNFAMPGYEAVHNSAYWDHVPYIGLGPGAHSFLKASVSGMHSSTDAFRQWNRPDLQAYIDDPLSVREHETLDEEQLVLERIMLSLRTSRGIPENYLREHCSRHALERAFSAGDLVLNPDGYARIPESRFFISDSIISSVV